MASMDITAFDVEDNLRRLLNDAPPTVCGICRVPMEAVSLDVNVRVLFDWSARPSESMTFFSYDDFAATRRQLSGNVTYRCPRCSMEIMHRQKVLLNDDGFHFTPPTE